MSSTTPLRVATGTVTTNDASGSAAVIVKGWSTVEPWTCRSYDPGIKPVSVAVPVASVVSTSGCTPPVAPVNVGPTTVTWTPSSGLPDPSSIVADKVPAGARATLTTLGPPAVTVVGTTWATWVSSGGVTVIWTEPTAISGRL